MQFLSRKREITKEQKEFGERNEIKTPLPGMIFNYESINHGERSRAHERVRETRRGDTEMGRRGEK
jgi:hypothetical protein